MLTNVGSDHLCEFKKNNVVSSMQQGSRAEIGSELAMGLSLTVGTMKMIYDWPGESEIDEEK